MLNTTNNNFFHLFDLRKAYWAIVVEHPKVICETNPPNTPVCDEVDHDNLLKTKRNINHIVVPCEHLSQRHKAEG